MRPVFKIVIAAVVIIVVVGIGLVLAGGWSSNAITYSTTIKAQSGSSTTLNASSILFNSTSYAAYSYLISGSNVSAQAKAALSGFNLSTTTLSNGSKQIIITFVQTGQNQTVVLRPGYKLYIVETSFGDDGFNRESSLADDGFVVVDPNGYVVG